MGIVLKRNSAHAHASFAVDLDNPKDLGNLVVIIHDLYPDRLFSFMRGLYLYDTHFHYGIDIIKDTFSKTPEGTQQHLLLRDILHTTFHHAQLAMHRAWEETIDAFQTDDLTQLTELLSALDDLNTHARKNGISTHDLLSQLRVHAISFDALEALLRRDDDGTPHHAVRAEILNAARCLVGLLDPSLFVDRRENPEPYHRSDLDGNTIAHRIADKTLFPGAEQIVFDLQKDSGLLALTNSAGQTVEDVYRARLAREAEVQLMPSL